MNMSISKQTACSIYILGETNDGIGPYGINGYLTDRVHFDGLGHKIMNEYNLMKRIPVKNYFVSSQKIGYMQTRAGQGY